MRVVKRHKRLCIVDDQDQVVYTPPDFIRLTSRAPLQRLAEALDARPYIDAVMEFETLCRAAK